MSSPIKSLPDLIAHIDRFNAFLCKRCKLFPEHILLFLESREISLPCLCILLVCQCYLQCLLCTVHLRTDSIEDSVLVCLDLCAVFIERAQQSATQVLDPLDLSARIAMHCVQ
ncbi:MAG: hypothetical protein AUI84_02860 [Delftia sp. 13_1_40CM_3_66_6]|nr:MAG: hypothetical protein AUI84_02860 [Delftia sp. 13_1_40CM_3_66_6]